MPVDHDDKVRIVDLKKGTIAGVKVDFNTLRNDLDAQRNVENVVSKKMMNFECVSKELAPEKSES